MGADRASYAGGQAFGSAARHRVARRGGRDLVYRADRLSVADAAEGLSSVHDGARRILRMRFGIGMDSNTLEEVGKQFSVTRERIRQIEAKALRKLKHPHHSRKLRTF